VLLIGQGLFRRTYPPRYQTSPFAGERVNRP